jgi:hypothetical protein
MGGGSGGTSAPAGSPQRRRWQLRPLVSQLAALQKRLGSGAAGCSADAAGGGAK